MDTVEEYTGRKIEKQIYKYIKNGLVKTLVEENERNRELKTDNKDDIYIVYKMADGGYIVNVLEIYNNLIIDVHYDADKDDVFIDGVKVASAYDLEYIFYKVENLPQFLCTRGLEMQEAIDAIKEAEGA